MNPKNDQDDDIDNQMTEELREYERRLLAQLEEAELEKYY